MVLKVFRLRRRVSEVIGAGAIMYGIDRLDHSARDSQMPCANAAGRWDCTVAGA